MPSWASETTSLTQLAQELGPERLGFGRADVHAEHLPPSVIVDTDGDDRSDRHNAAILADLHIGGVNPQIRPVAFDGLIQERIDALVDLLAKPRHLAFGNPAHAMALTRSSTERVETPW